MSALLDPRLSDCRRIFLTDFALDVSIGFHEFELKARQRVLINVDLFVPLVDSTPTRDARDEIVDYDFLRIELTKLARSRHFNLQETLLEQIVTLLLENSAVRAVRVSTEKPDVYQDCRSVGIEIFRFRDRQAGAK
jgi:7,8-dihydroneopterin aldolase/epimerase/oxygenase